MDRVSTRAQQRVESRRRVVDPVTRNVQVVPTVAADPCLQAREVRAPRPRDRPPGRSQVAIRSSAPPGSSRCSSTCQSVTTSTEPGSIAAAVDARALDVRRGRAPRRGLDPERVVAVAASMGDEPSPARAGVEQPRRRRRQRPRQRRAGGGRTAPAAAARGGTAVGRPAGTRPPHTGRQGGRRSSPPSRTAYTARARTTNRRVPGQKRAPHAMASADLRMQGTWRESAPGGPYTASRAVDGRRRTPRIRAQDAPALRRDRGGGRCLPVRWRRDSGRRCAGRKWAS